MQQRRIWLGQTPVQAGQYRRLFQRIHDKGTVAYRCASPYTKEVDPEESHHLVGEKEKVVRLWSCSWKRARFEEQNNEYHEDSVVSFEDRAELWYNLSEIKTFKGNARSYVRDIMKIEKDQDETLSYCGIFLQVYNRCCNSEPTATTCSLADEVITADDSHKLAIWMDIASDRWGLERLSIRKIHYDRSTRRKKNVRVILEVQSMTESLDVEVQSSYLRKAGEHITRPSALFAQLIAQAQETALLHK